MRASLLLNVSIVFNWTWSTQVIVFITFVSLTSIEFIFPPVICCIIRCLVGDEDKCQHEETHGYRNIKTRPPRATSLPAFSLSSCDCFVGGSASEHTVWMPISSLLFQTSHANVYFSSVICAESSRRPPELRAASRLCPLLECQLKLPLLSVTLSVKGRVSDFIPLLTAFIQFLLPGWTAVRHCEDRRPDAASTLLTEAKINWV